MSYILRKLYNINKVKVKDTQLDEGISNMFNLESYINTYGNHFNCKLADYASSKLTSSKWDTDSMIKYLKDEGINLESNYSLGDLVYMSNFIYSNLYPNVTYSLIECINMAKCILSCNFVGDNNNISVGLNIFSIWVNMNIEVGNKLDLSKFME